MIWQEGHYIPSGMRMGSPIAMPIFGHPIMYLGPDTHSGEVIDDSFDHGRIRRVGAALAGVKAVGMAGVFEPLLRLLGVVAVRFNGSV